MASLRSRLIVSVLALAAAGTIVLAAVTYAEQRSFLLGRVDQQVRAAGPPLSRALDEEGFLPAGASRGARAAAAIGKGPGGEGAGGPGHGIAGFAGGAAQGPGGGGGALPNLPPGTYGQRREASGRVLGHVVIGYGQSAPAAPALPAKVRLGVPFTVGSVGSSGLHYRAYARRDPEDSGVTVAAVPLGDVEATLHRLLVVEGLVLAGVLLALGVAAFLLVRAGLQPLERMAAAADAIAAGDLGRRVSPASARSEVGRLGLALNGMLARLERAFARRRESEERLRQFLADSSHELRTPLAAIRGYAELFRMGAAREPAEVELAMRRIEEESARMGVLVEDLLTLARLDEGREAMREPVDLAALAGDAVADARATAPQRKIALTAQDGAALVAGDPDQLRQVLVNLMGNALVHTPSGSPIEVAVRHEGESVTVSVRDHGPGLPPGSDPARLFERFWRAEGGRERGSAGAGLGLAIVAEIVAAHGGEARASDAPGGGALFAVQLPCESAGNR
ncbi:MAG TPA: HAMP domain-containing sensor histidine kinase [Solirubrobacteraceae bacterium]|nr:HAMP domain-containing sensor histidine kinase [Solirubrobacteraceae bacterium]